MAVMIFRCRFVEKQPVSGRLEDSDMHFEDELFGVPEQIALMRQGKSLWQHVQNDPRYSFYGRMVSLCDPRDDAVEIMISLARRQGAGSCQYYPADSADMFCAALEKQGMRAVRYEQCRGETDAYEASKAIVENHALPDDLSLIVIGPSSSPALVQDVAELSIACGVMPVPGAVMRGLERDGVCLTAVDSSGKLVATASCYLNNHPESSRAKDAFWGMLATHNNRRGERIGQILGAQAIQWMWDKRGARSFNTGITADNASSMALCAKLGVVRSKWTFIGCMDPGVFKQGSMTR